MQSVDAVLRQAAADLDAIGARWAVIGGLAVAFRAEPRFTKDVDVAVAVADDREAEDIVNRLQVRGYALASLVEQDYVNRLATARLIRPQPGTSSAFIDLLFANSGIEDEVVRRADLLEVLPDVFMPVASTGHLIALKVLAGRHQDLTDLGYLISAATDADLDEAQASVARIQERGYNRGQNLPEDLSAIISQARKLPAAQVDLAAPGSRGSPGRPGQAGLG
jgi:predicted nucleotidyltransferase